MNARVSVSWTTASGLVALVILAWGLEGSAARAQSPSDPLDSTDAQRRPLQVALEHLATGAAVRLVYDAELVRGHRTDCPVENRAPKTALKCLLDGTGLDFIQTSGGTYILKESVRRPPRRGAVHGVVRDADGGAPVPQVHVRTTRGSAGTVSDEEGQFHLSGLVAGTHTLAVSRLGYQDRTLTVTVPGGRTVRDSVNLVPSVVSVDPVIVNAGAETRARPSHEDRLSADALRRTTNKGTPSVPEAAASLMGITTKAPYVDLHVQGSASTAHQVRLDGVPIRNPAASGRLLGSFSSLALDDLTARKAGFGALQGNTLSGVLDLTHDLPRKKGPRASLRMDPVSADGRMSTRFTLGQTDVTAMTAARTSVWSLHRTGALSNLIDTWSVLDPALTAAQLSTDSSLVGRTFDGRRARPQNRFLDVHGAVQFDFPSGQQLFVSGYHGRSQLGADLVVDSREEDRATSGPDVPSKERTIEVPTSDQYDWSNTAVQARYDAVFSSRVSGHLQASMSRYRAASSFDVGQLQADPQRDVLSGPFGALSSVGSRTDNAVTEFSLDGTLDLLWANSNRFSVTGSVVSLDTRFHGANAFLGPLEHTDRETRASVAGHVEAGLGPHVTVEGGLRLTARPGRGGLYAEPRGAIRYRRTGTGIGEVALRIGGGVYRQYSTHFQLHRDGATAVVPTAQVWTPIPSEFDPPRTYHLATTATWSPHPAWTVGLEGYIKWQPHLLDLNYSKLRTTATGSPTPLPEGLGASHGRVRGGGLRISYDAEHGRATLRYARTSARRTFPGRFGGERVLTPWNEPHRLTLRTEVPLAGGVSLDLQGKGVWGRPWPLREAYYAYLSPDLFGTGGGGPSLDDPDAQRLPPLYRLDTGLQATHAWGGMKVTGRVGLVNVLDRANVADVGLRPTEDDLVPQGRTLPGRQATVSLRIRY